MTSHAITSSYNSENLSSATVLHVKKHRPRARKDGAHRLEGVGRRSAVARSAVRASIQCKHPHCAALRHIRELPWPLDIEARLHPRSVDAPSRLHCDVLLAVELE